MQSPRLQRQCSCGGKASSGGECESCKKKTLQRRATANAETDTAPAIVHEVLRSPGQPLDAQTRAYMEPRFGHDFSKVRIHTDALANESAESVNALAYTVGPQIVFGAGVHQPGARNESELLAHELAHVVQQSQTDEHPASLRVGETDSPFEKEADHMAKAVVSNQPSAQPAHAATGALQREPAKTPAQTPVQAPAQDNERPWGSKKWPLFENDWNAYYQLAIQGMASNSKMKAEKMSDLARLIADDAMAFSLKHGEQLNCAKAAAPDKSSRDTFDMTLPWGSTWVWGVTFRSALQSTTGGVDGPITAKEAVSRAGEIADQAARGMMGDALWKIYLNCKLHDKASPTAPPPKVAALEAH